MNEASSIFVRGRQSPKAGREAHAVVFDPHVPVAVLFDDR